MNKVTIRISEELCTRIRKDLSRPHAHAYERVGFLIGRSKTLPENEELICLTEYHPVEDDNYIKDDSVGARINSNAIREAMQIVMTEKCCMFHVHMHFGHGTPEFSETDLTELPGVAQAMINANPNRTHGILLLSENGADALVKENNMPAKAVDKVVILGYPMTFNHSFYKDTHFSSTRYDRQSFLGEWAQHKLSSVKIGVVGLGGGGSHIVQQLSHLGVLNFVIFDDDFVAESNLNRLVFANLNDAETQIQKNLVFKRLIKGLHPEANITLVNSKWQEEPELLHSCDVILGAVDSFSGRRDLELDSRRYLIPYIDIGMDVKIVDDNAPRLFGQVILSAPGNPCMKCIGFLNDEILTQEANRYGDAGNKPQVVWSNGVLASNAVGLCVDLITGWSGNIDPCIYQEYDGNNMSMTKTYRLDYLNRDACDHFPSNQCGPPIWK